MKTRLAIALWLTLAGLSPPAFAHDPSQHQTKDAAPPDCSKMKDMDMSKMDMNDPVMKAMHAKCKDQMPHDDAKHDDMQDHDMTDMPRMDKETPTPPDEDTN